MKANKKEKTMIGYIMELYQVELEEEFYLVEDAKDIVLESSPMFKFTENGAFNIDFVTKRCNCQHWEFTNKFLLKLLNGEYQIKKKVNYPVVYQLVTYKNIVLLKIIKQNLENFKQIFTSKEGFKISSYYCNMIFPSELGLSKETKVPTNYIAYEANNNEEAKSMLETLDSALKEFNEYLLNDKVEEEPVKENIMAEVASLLEVTLEKPFTVMLDPNTTIICKLTEEGAFQTDTQTYNWCCSIGLLESLITGNFKILKD